MYVSVMIKALTSSGNCCYLFQLFVIYCLLSCHYYAELGKLSLIEDRGLTDRVTALLRPYALDIDL